MVTSANGRHEHEWKVWQDIKLREGKVIMPGIIDNTTNIIEHPQVVADRIVRYAGLLGRENVIAGVDCGFSSNINIDEVNPDIAWAKLRALADGAALASKRANGTDSRVEGRITDYEAKRNLTIFDHTLRQSAAPAGAAKPLTRPGDAGKPFDQSVFEARTREAVARIVHDQVKAGDHRCQRRRGRRWN